MKHFYLLLFLGPLAANAQTISSRVTASGGGFLSSSSVHLSLTLGQPVAGDRTTTAVLLHQGFQVGITEAGPTATTETFQVNVFPNPTSDKLIVTGLANIARYQFVWTDVHGRELAVPMTVYEDRVEFSVKALNTSTYLLRIASAQGYHHFFKIVKTN
jgi:hypothetical protein